MKIVWRKRISSTFFLRKIDLVRFDRYCSSRVSFVISWLFIVFFVGGGGGGGEQMYFKAYSGNRSMAISSLLCFKLFETSFHVSPSTCGIGHTVLICHISSSLDEQLKTKGKCSHFGTLE